MYSVSGRIDRDRLAASRRYRKDIGYAPTGTLLRRERSAAPTNPKPTTNAVQVAGSGTAAP
jgi:hypothetical protein